MAKNRITRGTALVGALQVNGMTGATAASRYAGATASGAPLSGTFAVGDLVVGQDGSLWVCTVAGSPGTWAQAATALAGAQAITSASANALAVGRQGATSPALKVDASTASSVTGVQVKSAAAAAGVALSAISSGTDENLTLAAKGAGSVTVNPAVAVPAGGAANAAVLLSSTASLGLYVGSGAPSFAAAKGSLYLRTDGSSSSTRVYVASDSAGTWVAVTTAS